MRSTEKEGGAIDPLRQADSGISTFNPNPIENLTAFGELYHYQVKCHIKGDKAG